MLKVLLVDDEEIILKCMVETIDWESIGFEVVAQATDGKAGLEMYMTHQPDIIITDIYMPQMTGLELAQEVRKLSSETEFIILTAYSDFEYAKQAIDCSVASYQLKPIKNSDLINILLNLKAKIEKRRTAEPSAASPSDSAVNSEVHFMPFSDEQVKAVIKAVKTRNMASVQNIIDEYFSAAGKSDMSMKHLIDDISGLATIIEKEVIQDSTLMHSIFGRHVKPFTEISHMNGIGEVEGWLKGFLETIINSTILYPYINARPVVQRAITYIMNHYGEKISTKTVSDLLLVSPEHLTRLFKTDIGKTFMSYLVEYRISIAIDLLKNTNYKIYEISSMVGYPNVMYFNKIFKSITGNKPSHYQKPRKD